MKILIPFAFSTVQLLRRWRFRCAASNHARPLDCLQNIARVRPTSEHIRLAAGIQNHCWARRCWARCGRRRNSPGNTVSVPPHISIEYSPLRSIWIYFQGAIHPCQSRIAVPRIHQKFQTKDRPCHPHHLVELHQFQPHFSHLLVSLNKIFSIFYKLELNVHWNKSRIASLEKSRILWPHSPRSPRSPRIDSAVLVAKLMIWWRLTTCMLSGSSFTVTVQRTIRTTVAHVDVDYSHFICKIRFERCNTSASNFVITLFLWRRTNK